MRKRVTYTKDKGKRNRSRSNRFTRIVYGSEISNKISVLVNAIHNVKVFSERGGSFHFGK